MEWRVSFVLIAVCVAAGSSQESATPPTISTTDLYSIDDISEIGDIDLISGTGHMELERYKERVKILHNLLKSECPVETVRRLKREMVSDVDRTQLEVEKILYERMTRMLIKCRRLKMSTTMIPSTTTTTPTTTTPVPQPTECQSATNLSEAVRSDHSGNNIGGSYPCDTKTFVDAGKPWFRFAGEAGNRILDTCPPPYSCGSQVAFWTNDAMPSVVGTIASANVYGSWSGDCKSFTKPIRVMRCSNISSDLIYQYTGASLCGDSFCGMF